MQKYKISYILILVIILLSTLCFNSCEEEQVCLAQGTLIATPTGDKLIEELQIGDNIYSYDLATQQVQQSKVIFIKKSTQTCYKFKVSDESFLVATLTHPIYSPQTQRYELAEKWVNNELENFTVINSDNSFVSLTPTSIKAVGIKTVYDITVDSPHANFIANGFLVHNKALPPQMTAPVQDMEVISRSDSSLTLHWTVPGDNNVYSDSYELKISDSGFIDYSSNHDLWNYDNVDSLPLASAFGTKDTFEVKGLNSLTKYWFVIQTISNMGDHSMYSNEVVDTTL